MASVQTIEETKLHIVDPVTSPAWAKLVAERPSTLFHSPRWMQVLRDTYGLSLSSCVLERGQRPVAGIPWCEFNDFLGRRRISLAFSDFCDPLAGTVEDATTLAEAVMRDGHPWNLRARAGKLPGVEVPIAHRSVYQWQGIDLEGDAEALWGRLATMAQRGVRKAESSGVEVRAAADKKELREWYLLHLRLRRQKHHLLAQPYAFFERIWDAFMENNQGFLLLSVYQGRIIGGTLYLLWQDTCYYKFNASDPNYLNLRPNNLTMWQGMLEAKERGCTLLDLGRSPTNEEGLIAFKRNFGARDEELFSLTYETPRPGREGVAEAQALLKQLTRLFVSDPVPESVTEEAGALLYRYFA